MSVKNKKVVTSAKAKTTKKKIKSQVDEKVGQVAEGKTYGFETVDKIRFDELKVFKFDSVNQLIEIKTAEFSAVCPFSGLPDIATIHIAYVPTTGWALELKALKYYFMSYRNVGIYQEGVTAKIWNDLKEILGHEEIKVTTNYNIRGGMDVKCTEGGVRQYNL
jgi:7-cyano-7-deazaguanine reductase